MPRRTTCAAAEPLEARRLLALVDFVPGPYATPANRPDTPLGTISSTLPVEPVIAVSAFDPGNVAVASQRNFRLSTNGGSSFANPVAFPNPAGANIFNGTASVVYDIKGRLYVANRSGNGASGISVAQVSAETGATVHTRLVSNANDDKPFLAADRSPSSTFQQSLYVAWIRYTAGGTEVYFARSTDQGRNWSAPIRLADDATGGFKWPATVSTGPLGEVYVAYHVGGDGGSSGATMVRRSVDGGLTFGVAAAAFAPGESDVSYNVQTQPGGIPQTQFSTQGTVQPWVLADPVRPGQVYVITSDDPDNLYGSGEDADIVLSMSADGGKTWTRSTIISGPAGSLQLMPTATIDPFGNIAIAWYDNRRGLTNANDRWLFDVMASYSADGGKTFAAPFMVSDPGNAFDPDPGAATRFAGPPPTTRIGDTIGIALYGHVAHVTWIGNTFSGANRTGQQAFYDAFTLAGAISFNGDELGVASEDSIALAPTFAAEQFEISINNNRRYVGYADGLSQILISGGARNDLLSVDALPGVLNVVVDGGDGNDVILIGGGDLDSGFGITDALSVHGGTGTDQLQVFDRIDIGNDNWVISESTIDKTTTRPIPISGFESIAITAARGAYNNLFEVFLASRTIDVSINGGGGNDTIRFIEEGVAAGNAYEFSPGRILRNGGAIDLPGIEAIDFAGGDLGDVFVLLGNAPASPLTVRGGAGDDTFRVYESSADAYVSIATGAGDDSVDVNHDSTGAARVELTDPVDALGRLQIGPGGRVRLPNDAVERIISVRGVGLLGIAGILDINAHTLVLEGARPALAGYEQRLANGYNGGLWVTDADGSIISTFASLSPAADGLGIATGDVVASGPLGWLALSADDLAIRATYAGDANLDLSVDVVDIGNLATSWQGIGSWANGDFNYDRAVGIEDLGLLAANWAAASFSPALLLPGLGATTGAPETPRPPFGARRITALMLKRGRDEMPGN